MASRTDELHSHQFVGQRLVGALALRDPDPVGSPVRRMGGAAFAGLMVAVMALAVVGVYGFLRPGGGDSWRDGGAVIIEEETGARFVYLDGVLHPVLNHASALLILGSAEPTRALVRRDALAGVPRGAPMGIAGAPDPLPAAGDLVTDAWTLCSRPASAGGTESMLVIGARPTIDALGARALLAVDQLGGLHLVWNGYRFAIRDPTIVLSALGARGQLPAPVPAAALNAVPAGPELARIRLPGTGRPSSLDGRRIGQVFIVENQGGGRRFGVALAGGLADITQLQADLLLADPSLGGRPVPMTQAEYASAPRAATLVPTGDAAPPSTTPDLVRPAEHGGLCASFMDGATTPSMGLAASVGAAPGEIRVEAGGVDVVAVPPGRGVIVEALPAPASPTGSLAVVSDLGIRFPVPSREVLATLGYRDSRPLRLPAGLVALLPVGNALDPSGILG